MMKKNLVKYFLPVLVPVLLSGCGSKRTALLEAEIKGADEDTVYIRMTPVAIRDSLAFDTVRMESGCFSWNPDISGPVEVLLEFGKDRKSVNGRAAASPAVYQISFLARPGEKVRLRAEYEEGFLAYRLQGSSSLDVQTQLRNSVKQAYKNGQVLMDQAMEALAEGVEKADEAYVDSLFEKYAETRREVFGSVLDYVRRNPDDLLSGFFLLKHPDRDTFYAYYHRLGESVRNGILKERLDEAWVLAERAQLIKANAAKLVPGATAPDFTLYDLDGHPVKLSDFAGKYVVLDFWGTWCPWCVKGIPEMKTYYARHKANVVFLGIACRDKLEKVRQLVEKESVPWINTMNGSGTDDIALLYGVSGFPTKILLEPGLKVKNRYLGEVPEFYKDLDAIGHR